MTTPGLNIRWYSDAALTSQVGAGNIFTPIGGIHFDSTVVGATTFYVTQDDGCGESAPAMVDIVLDGGSAEVGEVVNTYPEQDIGAIEVINIQSDFPPYDIRLEDSNGNVVYDWAAVSEDRLGNYTYLFTLLPAGDYIAWVMDQNGCMFPVEQSIGLETEVFIPNVFTPNGDNYNDVFKVLNVSGPIQIQINNRWGVKVFESDDYQNDWAADNLPEGVYFYTIKMSGSVYKGNVEVWRNDGPLGN
jgi:gliding motility-associated-like protein